MLKVILIASGKGGTGKTSLAAGVGAALANAGHRVLLLDGDCGLRNLDIMLGMSDRVVYSFADVVEGAVPLCNAAVQHPMYETLYLLTAPVVTVPALSEREMEQLAAQAGQMNFDYLLIDGPAGLPAELSFFAHIATQAIIVTTPDSVSVRGAEFCARKLEQEYCIARIRMILNRVRPNLIRHGLANNIDDVMDSTGLPLLGVVPEDEVLIACGNSGKSILTVKRSGAARAFGHIARRLDGERVPLSRI